jgi:parallel beta-helix repeat protein
MEVTAQPIRVYQSGSLLGSIISMNSIINPGNGCIEIVDSDDIEIEGNIAFQTSGNCFVLKSSKETGILLKNNLGAQTVESGSGD